MRNISILKVGAKEMLTCLEGGAKSFGPVIFLICSPPLPVLVINERALWCSKT